MITETSAKNLWVLTHRTYTNILGVRNWSSNFPAIVPESAKRHPNSCDKVARLRSYEIRVAPNKVLTYCSYGTHGAVRIHGGN